MSHMYVLALRENKSKAFENKSQNFRSFYNKSFLRLRMKLKKCIFTNFGCQALKAAL
jgi:hypothetical protein